MRSEPVKCPNCHGMGVKIVNFKVLKDLLEGKIKPPPGSELFKKCEECDGSGIMNINHSWEE